MQPLSDLFRCQNVLTRVWVLARLFWPALLPPAIGAAEQDDANAPLPRRAREALLRLHTARWTLAPGVDLALLARMIPGFARTDLLQLCEGAARRAAHHRRQMVTEADFLDALDSLLVAGARVVLWDSGERAQTAYFHAGRALVAWRTPGAPDLFPLSILPGSGGATARQVAGLHHGGETPYQAAGQVLCRLGGYMAVRLFFDDPSPEAEAALREARMLLSHLRTRPGVSTAMGGLPRLDQLLEHVNAMFLAERAALTQLAEHLEEEEMLEEGDLHRLLGAPTR